MINGIGCDICDVRRIKKDEERLSKFILTKSEYEEYLKSDHKSYYLAGRFSAKESFVKALGGTIFDYEILNDENGKPVCKDGLVSISHDGDYALSFVVINEK